MNKITDITRQDIFDVVRNGFTVALDQPGKDPETGEYVMDEKVYMPFYGRLDEITFFSRLYDLNALPSTDHRYKNALGDISCHLRWGDYEEECWFFDDERFHLLDGDGDEPLLRFICEMLHPAVRQKGSPWKEYLAKFNELLRPDGYELYAAQQISGRLIYQAREYTAHEYAPLPDNLFTERYKDLIQFGEGVATDKISAHVSETAKKHLCSIMFEFAEPQRVQRNRYDAWIDNTDALSEAILDLNNFMEVPVIDLKAASFSPCNSSELLAMYFTPFIFDLIEYQYDELSNGEKNPFMDAINASLQKDHVSFYLSDRGLVEIRNDHEVLTSEIIGSVEKISEPGLRELLEEAIEKHMQPTAQAHRDAVEKIWDAFERLKTYYTELDKKKSAAKIVDDMAGGQNDFIAMFNAEFKALTDIGNQYRIRHHETSKIDITDIRHYDYFFNRCLSLITTALLYLE